MNDPYLGKNFPQRLRYNVWDCNLKRIGTVRLPAEFLTSLPLFIRALSPSNLLKSVGTTKECQHSLVDLYVGAMSTVLSVLLFAGGLPRVAPWVAMLAVVEILSHQLAQLLVDSQEPNGRPISYPRSIIIAFVNLYEIAVAYAILYFSNGHIVENSHPHNPLQTPTQSLYYSFGTMATLGYGDFVPADDSARRLVILHLATQIVFVLAVLPSFIGGLKDRFGESR